MDEPHIRAATVAEVPAIAEIVEQAYRPPPSSTLRYWNLARQRHCRPSAPYHRATPVSPDRVARSAPHTGGKSPAFRREGAKSRETRTLHWREQDSNHRSRG